MGKGSGVSRGDRRRNARLERLRGLLPRDGVVAGIDLGEDKQALAVVDHDGRVVWRKTARVKAYRLGEALDAAVAAAGGKGYARVTVACEPTGSRWMQVQRLCGERGLDLVCVQPLLTHVFREQLDYTGRKSDEADCVLIARLAAELKCYVPEVLDEAWAHLRHLGRRREQLVTAATAAVLRVRDFLSTAWPAALETCAFPFKSVTWLAAMQVVTSRCGADPASVAAGGLAGLAALAGAAVAGWGGKRPDGRVLRGVFAALSDAADAVGWSRRALLRRVADELGDLARTRAALRAVEAEMMAVVGELGLSRLGEIPGLSAVGAAVILAEAGDPRRYQGSSSLVKHAGLSPAEQDSGAVDAQARISRRGRPGLRTAVWRAVWPMIIHNPVMAAKYQALTAAADQAAARARAAAGPAQRKASAAERAARARRARSRVACAAALLRWIYAMTVHGTSWDPAEAGRGLAEAA
jgi:transposase